MIRFWLYIFALNSSLVPSSVKRPVRGARATSLQLSRPAHASCLMQFRRSYGALAGQSLFVWLTRDLMPVLEFCHLLFENKDQLTFYFV